MSGLYVASKNVEIGRVVLSESVTHFKKRDDHYVRPRRTLPFDVLGVLSQSLAEPSLYTVKALFILDNDGNRLLSKYYDRELYPSIKEQKNFERNVFNKTHKADNEIAFVEGMTVVYKSSIDLFFYVVGSAQENEVGTFLTCFSK
ncbi:Coatomer subunit zeta-1 [Liparis tanakae]|uniref:Coatomer subunit zeta n=1 Tax=Liparis tanakae TaxID=230148 RepID=A0A4Z2I018_9TELE|nr:Coatomer subunit zeta-1 [Liparis tanakae]